jgi:riboflavin kinase
MRVSRKAKARTMFVGRGNFNLSAPAPHTRDTHNTHTPKKVPSAYALPFPLLLEGAVTTGFGRGSRQLGTPTANLPPEDLAPALGPAPHTGVYFGWARLLDPPPGSPAADTDPHPAVLNIGRRPTFEGQAGGDLTVEVHALHAYAQDFYGRRLRVAVGGFLRPERRFAGVGALVARIAADIGSARAALAAPEHAGLRALVGEAGEP